MTKRSHMIGDPPMECLRLNYGGTQSKVNQDHPPTMTLTSTDFFVRGFCFDPGPSERVGIVFVYAAPDSVKSKPFQRSARGHLCVNTP